MPNAYDEWGIPATTNVGRFQYTGQIWLPELGLYYYKARIYSPTLGRFMQTDPIGYEDQVNLYAYVGNDPVNAVDPDGKEGLVVTGVGINRAAHLANDPDPITRLQNELTVVVAIGSVVPAGRAAIGGATKIFGLGKVTAVRKAVEAIRITLGLFGAKPPQGKPPTVQRPPSVQPAPKGKPKGDGGPKSKPQGKPSIKPPPSPKLRPDRNIE